MRHIRNLLFGLCALPLFLSLSAAEEELPPDPLRDRARTGETAAQLQLANEFFFGRNRPRNPTLAAYWFRQAAEQGSPEGAYNFAVCLERGWGAVQSANQAFSFYTRAAEAGRPEARLARARLLYTGVKEEKGDAGTRPAIPAEPEKALDELRRLSAENFVPAKFELARLLASDRERRKSCAAELRARLEEYAAQPNPEPKALLLLAECRRDGIGGSPSMEHAADAVERAMMLGDADAKALYARILEYGHGRRPDPEQAFRLTKEAAEAGAPPPCCVWGTTSSPATICRTIRAARWSVSAVPRMRAIRPPSSSSATPMPKESAWKRILCAPSKSFPKVRVPVSPAVNIVWAAVTSTAPASRPIRPERSTGSAVRSAAAMWKRCAISAAVFSKGAASKRTKKREPSCFPPLPPPAIAPPF